MDIKLLALDVDGVMTDGTIFYTQNGEEIKTFHAHDGLGIKYLQQTGVHVVVISGRGSKPLERRLKDIGVRRARLKCKDKVGALLDICDELGLGLKDCAFMGDDLIDLLVMEQVAYAMAPANAVDAVKEVADWVSERCGGEGAVRAACEHLAAKKGIKFVDLVKHAE